MTEYKSTKVCPYVYLCTHKLTGEFYIGYRASNVRFNRTSNEDFPRYRSSSSYVHDNFNQFDWVVLAEFFSSADAYDYEQQLIHEHWSDPLLINKHHCHNGQGRFIRETPPWNAGTRGLYIRTEETINKIKAKRAKQIMQPSPQAGKTYEELYGDDADVIKEKISATLLARHITRSDEFKQNLSKPKPLVTCPHCGKTGGGGSMKQWHFDKCRKK